MTHQDGTYKGLIHIPNHKPRLKGLDNLQQLHLPVMDTLVDLDGADKKVHSAWVGKIGSVYVSGIQEHTSAKVRDLIWDADFEADEEFCYASLIDPKVPSAAEISRPFPQNVLTINYDDSELFAKQTLVPYDESPAKATAYLQNEFGDKTVYVATSEPKLSGRVFTNINDAREDGRILAELAQDLLPQKACDQLLASRPEYTASLDLHPNFNAEMEKANGSIASVALSGNTDVSTAAALAIMSGAKTPDDKIIQALRNPTFENMTNSHIDPVPAEVVMDLRRNIGRDDRASVVTLTAGASALRKGDGLFMNQEATHHVMQTIETTLTNASHIDEKDMAKFMVATDVVINESQSVLTRSGNRSRAQHKSAPFSGRIL